MKKEEKSTGDNQNQKHKIGQQFINRGEQNACLASDERDTFRERKPSLQE